MGANLKALKIN